MAWKLTRIKVDRVYEVTDVPDLRDTAAARRRVNRPRTVVVHQIHGTNLVSAAAVEGRLVNAGNVLGVGTLIRVGHLTYPQRLCEPPDWLNQILAAEGLQWARDNDMKETRA